MLDVFDWLELEGRPHVERGLHGVGECAGDAGVFVPPVRESCPRLFGHPGRLGEDVFGQVRVFRYVEELLPFGPEAARM